MRVRVGVGVRVRVRVRSYLGGAVGREQRHGQLAWLGLRARVRVGE